MKVAIACFAERISLLFDVTARLLLVEVENGREIQRREYQLDIREPLAAAGDMIRLGIDVLICGAISSPLETLLRSLGVQVAAWTCGPVEDVLAAFLQNRLQDRKFAMPGRRWRRMGDPTEGRRRIRRRGA